MRSTLLLALSGIACVTDPGSTPPAADAQATVCPDGQVDLEFSYPDGRRLRECLAFQGNLLTNQCARVAFGGVTAERTLDDAAVLPRPPLPRFSLANEMNLGDARGTVTVPFTLTLTLDREGECAVGSRFCQYVSWSPDPRPVCMVEAVLPAPGGEIISYRLTSACQAFLVDPISGTTDPARIAITIHRADYRGPLRWTGDSSQTPHVDAGGISFPDCGGAL